MAASPKVPPAPPFVNWNQVADVLHITDDTLRKRRRKYGDRTLHPFFATVEEVYAWYRALVEPPPAPVRPARRTDRAKAPAAASKALDVRALVRELTGSTK